jgi:hypothetical protein
LIPVIAVLAVIHASTGVRLLFPIVPLILLLFLGLWRHGSVAQRWPPTLPHDHRLGAQGSAHIPR